MIGLLLLGVVIFGGVAFYRKRSASGKIVVKIVCAVLLVGFTFSMVNAAFESYESYKHQVESSQLEYRVDSMQRFYSYSGLKGLLDDLYYSKCFEPEFDQYWQLLIDAHNLTMETVGMPISNGR